LGLVDGKYFFHSLDFDEEALVYQNIKAEVFLEAVAFVFDWNDE